MATQIIDVRSPFEFQKGHIPGAVSVPLFSNDERKEIGIIYKEKGQRAAIEAGLAFVDLPRLSQRAKADRPLLVYCARGGMRSQSVVWLYRFLGCQVTAMPGGYKTYRRRVLEAFPEPPHG